MADLKIFVKDISELKEFSHDGTLLKFQEITEEGWYIYQRYFNDGRLMGFEVVRPKKRKNPDGSIVRIYPSTTQFGSYGLYFPKWMSKSQILERCRIEWAR